jgi:hypothetical protein
MHELQEFPNLGADLANKNAHETSELLLWEVEDFTMDG